MRRIFTSQKNSSLNSGFGMYVLVFYLLYITHPTYLNYIFIFVIRIRIKEFGAHINFNDIENQSYCPLLP